MRHQRAIAPLNKEDRAFFDAFLKKYEKFIRYRARNHYCPGIQTDDIVQEAELRLMAHIDTLRNLSHNKTCSFIAQAVEWVFYDLMRKEERHSYVSMDSALEEMLGTERDLVPDLFLRQELQRLRKHLTAREWTALKSKYVYGCSQEELGEQLEMAPNSVRTFLHRVRKRAKQILTPEKVTGGDDDD